MQLAILCALSGLFVAFTATWLIQLRTRNAGMIDPVWAASLGGIALLAAGLGSGAMVNRVCVLVGGGVWGFRLAAHLTRRNLGQPEDRRYRQLRETWGACADLKLFGFFQLQAAIAMLLSVAFFVPAFSTRSASPVAVLAAATIWCVGVAGESSADRQLRRFLRDPARRGQVCRVGWWRYTRHPNYFFECLHWCSYTALSLAMPWGWLTLLPPVLMAWLLLKLSGVPMLEAHLANTRPGYRDYMRTTSVLIPWPDTRELLAADDNWQIRLCERGWLPDPLVRAGMRGLMRQRLRDAYRDDGEQRTEAFEALVQQLRASPIAIETDAANRQHYELPGAFFQAHLGPRMKYSCCLYPGGDETLAEAEEAMLALYARRAGIEDGQRILDLGCGWGSLSLWLAERYPNADIVGLSNSHAQRRHIETVAARRGLRNLRILTGNVVDFEFDAAQRGFDRVLSIEMFEHMKNYGLLLARIARWLQPDGKLFVHLFAHRVLAYHFENEDSTDWMSRYFFTGGTMPSADLLWRFQDDLRVTRQWWIDGRHYARTANHWLASLDASRRAILPILHTTYGSEALIWLQRWRMFYMAVAELFGYANGQQWGVAHYLFEKARPLVDQP